MSGAIIDKNERSSGVVSPAKIVGQRPHVTVLVEVDVVDLLLRRNTDAALQEPLPGEVQQPIFKRAIRLANRRSRDEGPGCSCRYVVESDIDGVGKLPQDIQGHNAPPLAIKDLDRIAAPEFLDPVNYEDIAVTDFEPTGL